MPFTLKIMNPSLEISVQSKLAQCILVSKINYNTLFYIPDEEGKCMWPSNITAYKLKIFVLPLFCHISTSCVFIYNPLTLPPPSFLHNIEECVMVL